MPYIFLGKNLLTLSLDVMKLFFGKNAEYYYHVVRGEEHRKVNPHRICKSISRETTFTEDLDSDIDTLSQDIHPLSDRLAELLFQKDIQGRTLTIKIKYTDFNSKRNFMLLPLSTYVQKVCILLLASFLRNVYGIN